MVEPVDGFSVANPPSNEKLLDALARDFVEHHYDIRRLERQIITSRTYQLSAVPNATNANDQRNFSHARVRRLVSIVAAPHSLRVRRKGACGSSLLTLRGLCSHSLVLFHSAHEIKRGLIVAPRGLIVAPRGLRRLIE